MKPMPTKPPDSAEERVRSVESHIGEDHCAPRPVRNNEPEVADDSQEKQNASRRANPARRQQVLPG